MFDAIKPSTENSVVFTEDTSLSNIDGIKYSQSMIDSAFRSVMEGVVRAFARSLVVKGMKKEEITEKINDLLLECMSAGDINKYSVEWLHSNDWYETFSSVENKMWRCCDDANLGLWTFIDEVWSATRCITRGWRFENMSPEEAEGLTAEERTVLEKYDKVAAEFYEIEKVRNELLVRLAKKVIVVILMKHGETLSKLNAKLYAALCSEYSVENKFKQVEPAEHVGEETGIVVQSEANS